MTLASDCQTKWEPAGAGHTNTNYTVTSSEIYSRFHLEEQVVRDIPAFLRKQKVGFCNC